MYLILPLRDAEIRNAQEAKARGCETTMFWWHGISIDPDTVALDVEDGDGLTDDELLLAVMELPA